MKNNVSHDILPVKNLSISGLAGRHISPNMTVHATQSGLKYAFILKKNNNYFIFPLP